VLVNIAHTVEGLTRDEACRRFQPRVRAIARRLGEKARGQVEVDDLVSVGSMGLLEAFDRFSPERGLPFSAFADFRIRGAMMDALRGHDPFSRRRRQLARRLSQTSEAMRAELGRAATPEELAGRLQLSVDAYQTAVSRTVPVVVLPFDAPSDDDLPLADVLPDPELGAEGHLLRSEALAVLKSAINQLPDRQRQAVVLYYTEELSLAEIGQVFDVSVSRVSQILTEARGRLFLKLQAAGVLERAA
jgi:RNA polymerase sigma factor FliA